MPLNSSRQSDFWVALRVDRADHGFGERFAFLDRLVLQHGDDLLGLAEPALGGEPAGGFGHQDPQRDHDQRGDDADDEQCLPAEVRDQEVGGDTGEQQADREDQFVEQEEPAAFLGADEFVDVGGGDGDFTAGADALQEPEQHHRCAAEGEQARDVHRDEQDDGDQQDGEPADAFGEPAEADRAEQLPDVPGGQDQADLAGGQVPQFDQLRHREGDDQHGVGVEEGGGSDDDPDPQQPFGDRDPFQPAHQKGVGVGVGCCLAGEMSCHGV